MARLPALLLFALLSACLPNMDPPQARKELVRVRREMVVMEMDRTVGRIELFKLRNGSYPRSLDDLDTLLHGFTLARSTSMFRYARLDTGYQLDYITDDLAKFNGQQDTLTFALPPSYWNGLGCRRSNMMAPAPLPPVR